MPYNPALVAPMREEMTRMGATELTTSVDVDVVHLATALVLLLAFSSAMIWIGTWIGLKVRSPDAVMGVTKP